MALRHHARRVATRSAHTLEAHVSHDTTNHPAHQRHAAFTPACFALPSGTAPRKHTSHQVTKAAQLPMHCNITNVISPHGLYEQTYHTIPHRSPATHALTPACFAARRHANALSTKAAQIPLALRHHERRVATGSAHTLEANMSHDTTNHPAHQRHAAFTPACFALPSGTAPRKCTFHQVRANLNGTATSRASCHHTVCPHTRSNRITRYHKSSRSPATRCVYTSMFRAPYSGTATQTHFPPRPANPHGTATSRT